MTVLIRFVTVFIFVWFSAGCAKPIPKAVPAPPPPVTYLVPTQPVPGLVELHPGPDRVRELRSRIDRIIDSYDSQDALWGLNVVSLDKNEILYERNNRQLMIPASNMKIVTAAAALLELGPEFRFQTQLVTDGEIRNGTLVGNLFVIGSGDPTISSRMQNGGSLAVFTEWANQLRSQGIRKIDGSIIGVDSYFDDQRMAPGWPAHAFNSPYAAEISALPFNDNVIAVEVFAGRPGRLATVRLNPGTRYVRVLNRVITRSGNANRFVAYRSESSNTITLRGRIGTRDRKDVRYITVHEPAGYFAAVLRETLDKKGIRVRDSKRASRLEANTVRTNLDQYHVLITHSSPPLPAIIKEMMKSSHNLFADNLAKTLSAISDEEGSFAGAQIAIRRALSPLGIRPDDLILDDGSGLSSYNFLTPRLLSTILQGMFQNPLFPYFYDSFPIAGWDGTLRNRMVGTPAEGRVHAKTGYIGAVRSLSGYTTTNDGERIAFVMIANNFAALGPVNAAQDAVCNQLTQFTRK